MKNRKHAHYFRNVAHLSELDVYRVLDLFGVTDQALGHAIKKLLAPGGRGAGKDFRRDVQEAIDTLTRRLEMLDEDAVQDFEADVHLHASEVHPWPESEQDPAGDGGWIAWSGGGCPVPAEMMVEVELAALLHGIKAAGAFRWNHTGSLGDIIAYRVVPT
jgi:hypothetical protein